MDVVITVGIGSQYNDIELRYCLRAIERYLVGWDRVFIVGRLPSFIQNIQFIPCDDVGSNKQARIMYKVLKASKDPTISKDFFYMSDDHFLLRPCKTDMYPYYHKGLLWSAIESKKIGDPYRKPLLNTYNALLSKELTTLHFNVHCPIVYNKELFQTTMKMYDWSVLDGYVIKSLYANTVGISPKRIEFMEECKISIKRAPDKIYEFIKDRPLFTTGTKVMDENMRQVLSELYPTPSRFEKTDYPHNQV